MGKINEYQRQQLASSVVGVAGENKSGQIIAQGVNALGVGVSAYEAEQKKRMKVYDDLAANNSLMKWSVQMAEVGQQLQREYAGNPKGYSTALMAKAQEMMSLDAQGIQKPEVRQSFLAGATTATKQLGVAAIGWEFAKAEENALFELNDGLEEVVRNAGSKGGGVEAVMTSAIAASDTLDIVAEIIPHKDRMKLEQEYHSKALLAVIAKDMDNDAYGTARAILDGKYDNINVKLNDGRTVRVLFENKDKEKLGADAEKAAKKQDSQRRFREILQATDASQQWSEGYFAGEKTIGDIENEVLRARFPGSGANEGYIKNMEGLLAVALSDAEERAKDNPAFIGPLLARYNTLAQRIAGDVEGKIKSDAGEFSGTVKANAAAMLSEVLALRTEALSMHAKGHMERATLGMIEKTLSKALLIGVEAQEGSTGRHRWGYGSYRDDFGPQYHAMNTEINKMAGLSENQKQAAKIQAAKGFMRNTLTMQDATPGGVLTSDQYNAAKTNAMKEVRSIYASEYMGLKAGDMYKGLKIKAIAEDGMPVLDIPDSVVQSLKSGN